MLRSAGLPRKAQLPLVERHQPVDPLRGRRRALDGALRRRQVLQHRAPRPARERGDGLRPRRRPPGPGHRAAGGGPGVRVQLRVPGAAGLPPVHPRLVRRGARGVRAGRQSAADVRPEGELFRCVRCALLQCPRGGGGGWHRASVFGCLPLAAPIGLSPLHILTLRGSERVLVVSTEPPDDLSCLTTPGPAVLEGLVPVPLTRCIQMYTPSPCGGLPTPALTPNSCKGGGSLGGGPFGLGSPPPPPALLSRA